MIGENAEKKGFSAKARGLIWEHLCSSLLCCAIKSRGEYVNFRKGFSSPLLRGLLPVLVLALTVGIGVCSALLASAATAYSWPMVQQGSISEDVYSIQLMLQARGY